MFDFISDVFFTFLFIWTFPFDFYFFYQGFCPYRMKDFL